MGNGREATLLTAEERSRQGQTKPVPGKPQGRPGRQAANTGSWNTPSRRAIVATKD